MREASRRSMLRQLAAASPALLFAAACAKRPPQPPAFDRVCGVPYVPEEGAISAQFLGTSSILFRDRKTAILSDGFVTRPSRREAAWQFRSNEAAVESAMKCFGIDSIDAIFAGHSHYDHVLDAPAFAKRAKSVLLGSESTRNIALGDGLEAGRIRVVRNGETHPCGAFELTFIESAHSTPDIAPGKVSKPLAPPAFLTEFKSDITWSVLVKHGTRALLVHGSANYKFGALRKRRADVVYLGVGSLGRKPPEFVDAYWDEVVRRTEARRVFLVHWDDFSQPLDQELRPMPKPLDFVEDAMKRIQERAALDCVDVVVPKAWEQRDPFAGLT